MNFTYEYLPTMATVRDAIRLCEGRHAQQVSYSTFHDALTQVCFGCRTVRSSLMEDDGVTVTKSPSGR